MGKSKNKQDQPAKKTIKETKDYGGWWWCMSHAPRIEDDTHWFQMIPIVLFSAISILLVRMYSYTRPMDQFYWSGGETQLADFFSYYKVVFIMIAAILALTILLYRFVTQSFTLKKSYAYIPMAIYVAMVLISYACSEYKEFALWGYNDRFEGTVPLIAYMVILFFVFNMVNNEKNVKQVLYPILGSATILGLLGVTQATDHDFFRTALGQKLITPNLVQANGQTTNQLIDEAAARGEQLLSFTFQNKEIYQTVYNINYVSFYLTLLLPLVGLLFIRSVELWKEEPKWKPLVWGGLFALLLYNLIGSASSGGFFGMGVVVLLAFVVLNKKILRWWKPVAILLVITALVGGITFDRWSPEVISAVHNTVESTSPVSSETNEEELTNRIDYFDTVGNELRVSIGGKELAILLNAEKMSFTVEDSDGNQIALIPLESEYPEYSFSCEEFKNVVIQPAADSDGSFYIILKTNNPVEHDWNFEVTSNGVFYFNDFGTLVDLDVIPSIGFTENPSFGTGRGYIWSRSFPMMRNTLFVGRGADTYCLYFPHKDYVGKYSSGWSINTVVDKPHNMYIGSWIGTGGISTLALVTLWGIYIVQSILIYIRKKFNNLTFMDICGVGIALGITGFVFTGLVDDSTVSTMPMFYTLLGLGLVINQLQKSQKTE